MAGWPAAGSAIGGPVGSRGLKAELASSSCVEPAACRTSCAARFLRCTDGGRITCFWLLGPVGAAAAAAAAWLGAASGAAAAPLGAAAGAAAAPLGAAAGAAAAPLGAAAAAACCPSRLAPPVGQLGAAPAAAGCCAAGWSAGCCGAAWRVLRCGMGGLPALFTLRAVAARVPAAGPSGWRLPRPASSGAPACRFGPRVTGPAGWLPWAAGAGPLPSTSKDATSSAARMLLAVAIAVGQTGGRQRSAAAVGWVASGRRRHRHASRLQLGRRGGRRGAAPSPQVTSWRAAGGQCWRPVAAESLSRSVKSDRRLGRQPRQPRCGGLALRPCAPPSVHP